MGGRWINRNVIGGDATYTEKWKPKPVVTDNPLYKKLILETMQRKIIHKKVKSREMRMFGGMR